MTTYRLFPSTSGGALAGYGGNFLAGVIFQVTQGGMWFQGYWWWCPSGGDTGAQKFALWSLTASGTGVLVPDSVVTSGTLTADAWNYVPLPSPLPIAIGSSYNACTGWVAVNGFPSTNNQFGSGQPFAAGITNGPLFAFSDTGGSAPNPYGAVQGVFSTGGSDPSLVMPANGSNSANFWMDLQVSDTTPSGYTGTYQLWPNKYDASNTTGGDSAVDYNIATVFTLSEPCYIEAIGYWSQSGAANLATEAGIWSVTGGGLTGSLVADNSSPSWSGAAGSGWVWASFSSPPLLSAGTYKVGVYDANGTAGSWSSTDTTGYWDVGPGASGITNGPIAAPNLASAPTAYVYTGGGTTETGQSVFGVGPPNMVPNQVALVSGHSQNYWVDVQVQPPPAPTAPPPIAFMASM